MNNASMPHEALSSCVYTVLLGDYETLNEQPVQTKSDIPFICLTDNPELKSASWRIIHVDPSFQLDPVRSQRLLKICPHSVPALASFERTIYIDNSVILDTPPEEILARYGGLGTLCVPTHSFRESVLDEFIEVARYGVDDQSRVFEQLNHYLATGEPTLAEKPYWTGMLLRNMRDEGVQATMNLWALHILRYSRRDQLSFNLALRQTGTTATRLEIDTFKSWFHRWPHTPGRKLLGGIRNPLASHTPLSAQIRLLQQEADSSRERLHALEEELELLKREAEGLTRSLSARVESHAQALGELRSKLVMEKELECKKTLEVKSAAEQERARAEMAHQEERARAEMAHREERARAEIAHQAIAADLQQSRSAQLHAEAQILAMQASRSWRITAPLRRLRGFGRQ